MTHKLFHLVTIKVLKYNIGSNIDLHTQQTIGAYNNRKIYFDFYTNYKVVDFSIEEQEGKAKTGWTGLHQC